MQIARWEGSDYASNYVVSLWRKVSRTSPGMLLLVCAPVLITSLAAILKPRDMLWNLMWTPSLWMLPMAVRSVPGRLKIKPEIAQYFESSPREAIPVDIRLVLDGEDLGEDEGILLREDAALVFRGNHIEFILYADMVVADPKSLPKVSIDESPGTSNLFLDSPIGVVVLRIRQRSFCDFTSGSDRLWRVVKDWQVNGPQRTLDPILPPLDPSPEASFAIISAYAWTVMALMLAIVGWFYTAYVFRPFSGFGYEALYFVVNLALTAAFVAIALYGLRLGHKRKSFYARFETQKRVEEAI